MATFALAMREAGATIIGGCCGTTPEHLAAMADNLIRSTKAGAPGSAA
jgi:5-methyltetrahydrofolate--homocysteine methyltransferase